MRWLARVARLVVTHPVEAIDRALGHFERLLDRWGTWQVTPGALDASSAAQAIHSLLGADWPCACASGFATEWDRFVAGSAVSSKHDADPTLAGLAWAVAWHLRARTMVETGVARGVTSRFLLLATSEWDGHLWSVDLPPVYADWRGEWGEAVEDALRERWHLVRGSSRRRLKPVLRSAGAVDVVVLDSDHTTRTVQFECLAVWPALRAGGILLVDDVDRNRGFVQFVAASGCRSWLVVRHALKGGLVGVARKAGQ